MPMPKDEVEDLSFYAMLARIDERTKNMDERLGRVEKTMVTKEVFAPFKVGIFAVIGSIVTAFGSALYAAVFHGNPPPR